LVTRILFDIGCEVEIKYFNLDNNESPINLDKLPTGEWATFILKKKVELKSPVIPQLRRRGVWDNGGVGTTRGRPDDIDTSQQQDQQNRNNSVNTNNNNNNNNEAMDEDGSVFHSPTNNYWNENENFHEELPQLRELGLMIESTRQDLHNNNLDQSNND